MRCVGLIVEGPYDGAVLTELIRKCLTSEVDVKCRPCGGTPQLMKQFPGYLEEFRYANVGQPVDRAIVVRDADGKKPTELIARMESKIKGRIYRFPRHLLVIVQKLEAWLLADEEALSTVTSRIQHRIADPEKIHDPKVRLRKILSDDRIAYTEERARMIAAAARLDVLAERCPSFRRFQEAVVNG